MYQINPRLATHGLEAQWGSGLADDMILQPDSDGMIEGFKVLDIRERMLDAKNPVSTYRKLTDECISLLEKHQKVVICCSAGVSRSNSIAIAVLVKYFGFGFEEACKLVRQSVPIANPLPVHLRQVMRLC